MRKRVLVVLALVLCLILSACGTSEAVKNVEAQINALGEISPKAKLPFKRRNKPVTACPRQKKESFQL